MFCNMICYSEEEIDAKGMLKKFRLNIEGAAFEDGKGLSNRDVFCHAPGKWSLVILIACGAYSYRIIMTDMITMKSDKFSGKIENDENGDISDDHYHRYLVISLPYFTWLHYALTRFNIIDSLNFCP
ncbi:hypothetical protein Fmac_025445 [Flemingia macrophylla]|uniref:Uncharacterized protein n=1 Tax=Flemingia macrophylla TaxID=520843 RepID=A0ABD1LS87_9FABA